VQTILEGWEGVRTWDLTAKSYFSQFHNNFKHFGLKRTY
jgi:hypothetical protein